MKASVLLILSLYSCICYSMIHLVGQDQSYTTPNALYLANVIAAGDTIEIEAATYSGTATLANWNKNDLLIRGINGRPHLVADGAYIQGKGIWVLSGNNITVENIEFSGARVPDKNGAGIRLDGVGLTVRYCRFSDNEDGILTSNQGVGDVVIEYSEFGHSGFGDGFSHNLYIGRVNSLTFRFNYSHHANIGHTLKSRAKENYIYCNRIMDEEDGNSSRLIDLPNGGFSIISGNLFMQGEQAPNSNMIGYGQEGLSNPDNRLFVVNNTFVNKRTPTCLFIDIDGQPELVSVINNLFAGTGTLSNGKVDIMHHNLHLADIADAHFEDEPAYNYKLTSFSPAIDSGIVADPVDGHMLLPRHEYIHPTNANLRDFHGSPDLGAYEFVPVSSVEMHLRSPFTLHPNPTSGIARITPYPDERFGIAIFDSHGRVIRSMREDFVDLRSFPSGLYYVSIKSDIGQVQILPIVKSESK